MENWKKQHIMFGQAIKGTNVIACKCPLDDIYKDQFEELEFYNLERLLTELREAGYEISSILDLN